MKAIRYLLNKEIDKQLKFGKSKYKAKEKSKKKYEKSKGSTKGYNSGKVEGIYSVSTAENYRQVANELGEYLKGQGYARVHSLNDIPKQVLADYIQGRAELSAWTTSRDISAINKIFGTTFSKKELQMPERKLADISRSRLETKTDERPRMSYSNQICVAQGTGIRRQSMLKITPRDFKRDENGKCVAIGVVEKGGRYREAPILADYRDRITEIVNSCPDVEKPLFEKYDKNIDNHAFRSEYASTLYNQCLENGEHTNGENYRGYDKGAIQYVSNALGHSRLNVVVEHYIR